MVCPEMENLFFKDGNTIVSRSRSEDRKMKVSRKGWVYKSDTPLRGEADMASDAS